MERRTFTCGFEFAAVKLIRERGVTVAQASRDLGGKASTAEMVQAIAGAL